MPHSAPTRNLQDLGWASVSIGIFVRIIDIATIAQRVNFCTRASGGDDVAVGFIFVDCYGCAIGIDELRYIALQIGDVIIHDPINLHRKGSACLIVEEVPDFVGSGCRSGNHFPQQLTPGIGIVVGVAIGGFSKAQTVGIIGENSSSAF